MLSTGTVLDGRYEIVAPLGAGGMGQVYRARRLLLGDEVAVKVMNASFEGPSDASARFLRESRACAQLRHPHIVSILDYNVDSTGQPYLVMELLSGPSLREEIALNGAMAAANTVAVMTPIATALQLAHDCGITHRDLKPANIVSHRYETGERVYKVIDFGLASVQVAADETRLTDPNLFLGTLAYAAPEQLRGEAVDARTDIYALGALVYELLTGRPPFGSENRLTVINQTLTMMPAAIGGQQSGLSAEIDRVVMRALAKDPAERWPTATAFVTALAEAAGVPATRATNTDSHAAILSRYDLGSVLGRGRLGSLVYRGTHRALGVPVAIRILRRDELLNWEAVRDRFLIEARTLQVPHPNLLHVRDYGEDQRIVYLVTDFIDGPSLREELARAGKFAWPRVATFLAQMLDATATLNTRGGYIVGVNPDMIRLRRDAAGDVIVLSSAGITSVQDVLATMREQELRGNEASELELPYVAPEVVIGGDPQPASDVFTAAVLAYQMLTGTLPFRAPSLPELIGRMLQTPPAEPGALNYEIPASASAAIARALSPNPAERFTSADAFAAALL
ncbi:MAG TPA: serine/threonine-protein kinase [Vicinamibacterales bacterium]|nr:serine/threonine-protein kinase [Vicinamibacterales bacterium]